MFVRRSFTLVAMLAMIGACGGTPGTTAQPGGHGAGSQQPTAAVPASTPSGVSAGVPPSASAGATISGTIEFTSFVEEKRTDTELKTTRFDVTIVVSLVRDPSDPGERYIDSGSTYQIEGLIHGERVNGACTAITDVKASNEVYAFTDQPTFYENAISAVVKRASGTAKLDIYVSWPYLQTVDDCPNDSSFSGESSTGLGCTGLGLEGRLIEGPTGAQIDMACTSDPALTTVTGILTVAN